MDISFRFVCGQNGEIVYCNDKKIVCRRIMQENRLEFFLNEGNIRLFGVEKRHSDLDETLETNLSGVGKKWLKENGYNSENLGIFYE